MYTYLVTRQVVPKDYLSDNYRGPVNIDWAVISAPSPGKAKSIAQNHTRACDENFIHLRCRILRPEVNTWIKSLTPAANGVIFESELDWYARQVEYDYSAHYG